MAWGGVDTYITGQLVTAANLNKISDDLAYLHGDAGVVALASGSGLSIPSGIGGPLQLLPGSVATEQARIIMGGDGSGYRLAFKRQDGTDLIYFYDTGKILAGHDVQAHGRTIIGENPIDPGYGALWTPNWPTVAPQGQPPFLAQDSSPFHAYINSGSTSGDIYFSLGGVTVADVNHSYGLRSKGMMVHRHPYTNYRHIETGAPATGSIAWGSYADMSLTFTDSFAGGISSLVCSTNDGTNGFPGVVGWYSLSNSGVTFRVCNTVAGGAAASFTMCWIAEGAD